MSDEQQLPNVWVVRADGGEETQNCVDGGFTGIGWKEVGDLSDAADRSAIAGRYAAVADEKEGSVARGQVVGNLSRFLLEMKQGDWVITPESKSRWLRYGEVTGPYRHEPDPTDDCQYHHRRDVRWNPKSLDRWELPLLAQESLRSALTVYTPSSSGDLFAAIGRPELSPKMTDAGTLQTEPTNDVLSRLGEMCPYDFERLIEHLLAAMGFEDTMTTNPTGDGGFDVYGVLNASNIARVEIYGQVKRQKAKVSGKTVRDLRGAIPVGAQGAFFTTSDYQPKARAVADEGRFPRIGLINGYRLVELLVQHWDRIPEEFRNELALKPGLVPA